MLDPHPAPGASARPQLPHVSTPASGASRTVAEGAWVWKDADEAVKAAVVLFVQRYGRAMRERAGAGADGPRKMLAIHPHLSGDRP